MTKFFVVPSNIETFEDTFNDIKENYESCDTKEEAEKLVRDFSGYNDENETYKIVKVTLEFV